MHMPLEAKKSRGRRGSHRRGQRSQGCRKLRNWVRQGRKRVIECHPGSENQVYLLMISYDADCGGKIANTSRCGCQCAVRVVPIPVGRFVECVLDIVHKPKHFRLEYQVLRKIILAALTVWLEKQAGSSNVHYSRMLFELLFIAARFLGVISWHSACLPEKLSRRENLLPG